MPQSSKTVSDHLVERLESWGVKRIFGFPGDGINGLLAALQKSEDRIEFVQAAHEELAGLMAVAHAKFTGEVAVCMVTSGPGAIHLLNGLYDAKLDHQPVVAIVGQQAFAGVGGSAQQETDLHNLLKDVASEYIETIASPEQMRHVVDRAFRVAHGRRSVTAIIIPHDVQRKEAKETPEHKHGRQHSSPGWWEPRILPTDADLRAAADVLNAGKRVAILVGAGALDATDDVVAVAEQLGAGVAKALLGKGAVPDDLPYVTGTVGWLGTRASNRMMEECDTLLIIGSTMPYTEFLPKEGQARGVQIDIEPKSLAIRYPMDVALVGKVGETLRALLPLLERRTDNSWRERIETSVKEWHEEAAEHAMAAATPLNPQRLFHELSSRLPDRAIITADSGSSAVWCARHIRMRSGMQFSVSGGLATMGCGVPYALAAKMAFPDRVVVATTGDGAMQMIGINSLIDIAKRWHSWSDPRLIVLALNNRDLNYVTWEQRAMEGAPKFTTSQQLPDVPYADLAKLLGLDGVRVETPNDVGSAWDRALAADRPFIIDAVVDADVPTLPPWLTPQIQQKLDSALSAGDEDAAEVREQLARQDVAGEDDEKARRSATGKRARKRATQGV